MLAQLAARLKALEAAKKKKEQSKQENLVNLSKLKVTLAEEEIRMRAWVC